MQHDTLNQLAQAQALRAPSRPPPVQQLGGGAPGAPPGGQRLTAPSRPPPVRGQGAAPMRGGGQRINSRPPQDIPVQAPPAPVSAAPVNPFGSRPQGPSGMASLAPGAAQGQYVSGPMNRQTWVPG